MKYMKTFLVAFVVLFVLYIILWMGISAGHIYLAFLMIPVGLGVGGCFIMTLVCFVFKK